MYIYIHVYITNKKNDKNRKCHSCNRNNSRQFSHTNANLHHIKFSFHIALFF